MTLVIRSWLLITPHDMIIIGYQELAPDNKQCLRHSILQPSKKCLFSGMFFGVFVVKSVAKLALKCDKRCHFGTTRMTPCCNMLSFSQTLFLKDPTTFWLYFPMLAEPGLWKKRSKKTLETYLGVLCEKNTLRNLKNHKTIKKTITIEDRW